MRQDEVVIHALDLIKSGNYTIARAFVTEHYPRLSPKDQPLLVECNRLGFNTSPSRIIDSVLPRHARRSFSEREKDKIFSSDFHQCRYSGLKLFSPPVITILSIYLQDAFPSYKFPNCPLARNHQGIWTLYPSPEHIVSLKNGGTNELSNLVTASSTLNMVKGRYSREEMGWPILERTELDPSWDGGKKWFLELYARQEEFQRLLESAKSFETFHRNTLPENYFRKWVIAFQANSILPIS